jgi:cation-dependent mannose-6-phosphate receptor
VPRRLELGSRGPTKEEREFMLGGDDDEDEESDYKPALVAPATAPSTAESSTRDALLLSNRGDANTTTIRGRDNGEGTIRL